MTRLEWCTFFTYATVLSTLSVVATVVLGSPHLPVILLLEGIVGAAMACVIGYSSVLGFPSGPLPYFDFAVRLIR